jgi:hypothetical protein
MSEMTTHSIRLDRTYREKVERWRKKLQDETPGVNITVSDAVRSMIGAADEKRRGR